MPFVLGLLIIYAIIHLGLIAVAVVEGLLLHWLMPSLDVGVAIALTMAATIASVYVFLKLMQITQEVETSESGEDAEEEEESEEETSPLYMALRPMGRKRRRRKKRP